MTEPQTPPEAPQDATEQGDPTPDSGDTAAASESGNREAARYRRRLRETESERDTMAQRLSVMQRAEAERLASSRLADGADLWHGVDLDSLLSEDGGVDADAVKAAVEGIIGQRPHYARRPPDLKQGQRGSVPKQETRPGAIFTRADKER